MFPKGDCNEWMFKCSSEDCIPFWWKCDSTPDCPDGSDELECHSMDDDSLVTFSSASSTGKIPEISEYNE